MLVGYTLINIDEINSHKQLDALIKIGVDMRRIYQDKAEDGIKDREKLNLMLEGLVEGDIVVVTELARFSANSMELLKIVENIASKGAHIISIKEDWFNTTKDSSASMFEVLRGIVQLDNNSLDEKTEVETVEYVEKIDKPDEPAKQKVNGRPKKASKEVGKAIELYNERKLSVKEIEEVTGVSKATLYRYLKEINSK